MFKQDFQCQYELWFYKNFAKIQFWIQMCIASLFFIESNWNFNMWYLKQLERRLCLVFSLITNIYWYYKGFFKYIFWCCRVLTLRWVLVNSKSCRLISPTNESKKLQCTIEPYFSVVSCNMSLVLSYVSHLGIKNKCFLFTKYPKIETAIW